MQKVLETDTAQKIKFSIKNFFSKCGQIRRFLTEELLDEKLHFLYSVNLCQLSMMKPFYERYIHTKNSELFSQKRFIIDVLHSFINFQLMFHFCIFWGYRSETLVENIFSTAVK